MPTEFGLADGDAQGHPLFFEAQYIEVELGPGDFSALQFDHAADAMLGVNDKIADIEVQGLSRHEKRPFSNVRSHTAVNRPAPRQRPPGHGLRLANTILHETTATERDGL